MLNGHFYILWYKLFKFFIHFPTELMALVLSCKMSLYILGKHSAQL